MAQHLLVDWHSDTDATLMQVFLVLRAVTGETVKLAAALIAILIPLYFAALAIEYLRGSASVPAISVASILQSVGF